MNEPPAPPSVAGVPVDWATRSHVRSLALAAATAAGFYTCYLLAHPFLSALVWALALAVMCAPLQRWLESKLKHPNLAASISTLSVALVVAVPAMFVGQRLILEAAKGAEMVRTKVESGEWRCAVEAQPRLALITNWLARKVDLTETVGNLTNWLTKIAGSAVRGSLAELIGFGLTFYLLFYFLRDRRSGLQAIRALLPLSTPEIDQLFLRVGDTIHATIYGTLVVSALQGLLGGLMFWWLGLPSPLLWGLVMGVLGPIPVLGAFVVWIPAAFFLALEGSLGKASILTLWGGLVVASIDNMLYPILVGNRLKMHTILAFLSVVGGLVLFGSAGIILGPVVLSVTAVLLGIWRGRTAA